MFEHVVFRFQLLPVLVKRRPGCPDSILDFGRLPLPERSRLAQVFHAFSSCQYFDFYVIDFHFLFCVSELRLLWLLRLFVSSGWILRPTFPVLGIAQNFLKLFFGCCEQKHVVGKPQVREAVVVVVAEVDSHSFFLLPALDVVFQ